MIIGLARKYIADSIWPFILAVALCTLGVSSVISIVWLQDTLQQHAVRQAEGIDLIVGAKGSGLQNTLAAVYHADVPNGNITLAAVEQLAKNPMIARTEPISLGDSVGGARIVGARNSFFDLYGAKTDQGAFPRATLEAVVGANAAKRLKLKVGESFQGSHGLADGAEGGMAHGDFPYTVVGILAPTGRVIDELIVTPLESVWAVHEGHTASTEPEVTFALLTLKSPIAMATLPRAINSQTNMQASAPAIESARLLANFGWVALLVKAFAFALIAAATIATFAALSQALERRQTDLALLRAVGASRRKIAGLVIAEALAVVLVAAMLALPVCATAAFWLSGFALPGIRIDWAYGLAVFVVATLAAVALAGIAAIPTIRSAFRIDVATQLSRG